MAFVPSFPVQLHSRTISPCLSGVTSSRPVQYRRRTSTIITASSDSATAPTIQTAQTTQDLCAIRKVWDVVASHEDLLPVPREEDEDATTVHVIARSSHGRVIGAGRLCRVGQNARLDRVSVLPEYRGHGVGRKIVERLLVLAAPVRGAIYVEANKIAGEMGFYSILGFETLGNDKMENGVLVRTMVYRVPVCAPSMGCVGLHHTSIRVTDIERSLAFYGSLGFVVSDKFFTSGGRRACFVEGLGTRLEFVEASDGKGGMTGVQGIPTMGFDRLVFDVTRACTDLDVYLQHLQKRNGGVLTRRGEVAKQVVGGDVMSVATIEDPDGLPIEFIKQEAQVPGELRTRVNW